MEREREKGIANKSDKYFKDTYIFFQLTYILISFFHVVVVVAETPV